MPGTEHLDQNAPSKTLDRKRAPNLDLASLFNDDAGARAELEFKIRKACLETGFFFVHNGCVSESVIRNARDGTGFHQLPEQ